MPLKSGGAIENTSLRAKPTIGLLSAGKLSEVLLFSDGFESGDFINWGGVVEVASGNMSVQSIVKYAGAYAARCYSIPHDGFDYCLKNLPSLSPYSYIKHTMYIYIDSSLTFASDELHAFVAQGDTDFINALAYIGVVRRGSDYLWFYKADVWETDGDPIPFNTWVKAEMRTYIGDSAHGYVEFWIDNVLKSTSGLFDTTTIASVAFGNTAGAGYGSTFDPILIYGDDCRVVGIY